MTRRVTKRELQKLADRGGAALQPRVVEVVLDSLDELGGQLEDDPHRLWPVNHGRNMPACPKYVNVPRVPSIPKAHHDTFGEAPRFRFRGQEVTRLTSAIMAGSAAVTGIFRLRDIEAGAHGVTREETAYNKGGGRR